MKKECPENKNTKQKAGRHSSSRWPRYILNGLFVLLVCCVTFLIYIALSRGMEFPTAAEGQIVTRVPEEATSPAKPEEPSEAVSDSEISGETLTEVPDTEAEPVLSPEEQARKLLKELSPEEKVWQMMVLSPEQTKDANGKQLSAGAVYFAPEDLTNPAVLKRQMADLQKNASLPLLMGVCEEGGSVAPLHALGMTDDFGSMSALGAAGDAGKAEETGKALGSQLKEAGFHFNLAPLADLVTNPYNQELGDRPFSPEEAVTSKLTAAMVKGMQESGTAACLKHFPGLGSTAMEGGRYQTYRNLEELEELELKPFRAGIDAGAQMVLASNMSALVITGNYTVPCSMYRDLITGVLREEMGFGGVILSDFQNTDLITRNYTPGNAAVNVIAAGCDAVLLPADPQAAVDAVLEAVENGTLTQAQIDASVSRILTLKARCGLFNS